MGAHHTYLFSRPELATLDDADRSKLREHFRELTSPAHRTIYREGDAAPGPHLVISGFVKLTRSSPTGKELLVSLAGPGDMFGPCCDPLGIPPAVCTAVSQTNVHLLVMAAPAWRTLTLAEPNIARALMLLMSKVRRGCTDLAPHLAFHSVEARIAALLGDLTRWSASANGTVEIPPILTQAEMAQAVGTAREVVTRCLARFEEQGLIRRRGRRILLPDPSLLAQVQG